MSREVIFPGQVGRLLLAQSYTVSDDNSIIRRSHDLTSYLEGPGVW